MNASDWRIRKISLNEKVLQQVDGKSLKFVPGPEFHNFCFKLPTTYLYNET
jgi:hypothetical protein